MFFCESFFKRKCTQKYMMIKSNISLTYYYVVMIDIFDAIQYWLNLNTSEHWLFYMKTCGIPMLNSVAICRLILHNFTCIFMSEKKMILFSYEEVKDVNKLVYPVHTCNLSNILLFLNKFELSFAVSLDVVVFTI